MKKTERVQSLYLDSSALVKLLRSEPETGALRELTHGTDRLVSELSAAELARFAHRTSDRPEAILPLIEQLLGACEMIALDRTVLEDAGSIKHRHLGTLDAIHLASALGTRFLDAFVTYDVRQAEAGRMLGLNVLTPLPG